jgi:hypothetical protein
LLATISCNNKKQSLLSGQTAARYITRLGKIVEKTSNSVVVEFPDSIEVVGYTVGGQYVESHKIRVTCECKSGGSCDPFYVPSVGKAGCFTNSCTNCNMTLSTSEGTLQSFAFFYKPRNVGKYLALLNFVGQKYKPADFRQLHLLTCSKDFNFTGKDLEILNEMFVAPKDYNKPFLLYPIQYGDKVFYVATREMTVSGYYIPVSSIKKAKCIGCNGECSLQRVSSIIFCSSTCEKCTLEVQ